MNLKSAVASLALFGLAVGIYAMPQAKVVVQAPAQVEAAKPIVDEHELAAARTHIHHAYSAMRRAMGIYGGFRKTAMDNTSEVLKTLNEALPVVKTNVITHILTRPASTKIAPPHKVEPPKVDTPKPVKTEAEKIADSQAEMAKAKEDLEAAAKELENAKTWKATPEGTKAIASITAAIEHVQKSIDYVAKGK